MAIIKHGKCPENRSGVVSWDVEYFNEKFDPVDESSATRFVRHFYDAEGNVIEAIHGLITKNLDAYNTIADCPWMQDSVQNVLSIANI